MRMTLHKPITSLETLRDPFLATARLWRGFVETGASVFVWTLGAAPQRGPVLIEPEAALVTTESRLYPTARLWRRIDDPTAKPLLVASIAAMFGDEHAAIEAMIQAFPPPARFLTSEEVAPSLRTAA